MTPTQCIAIITAVLLARRDHDGLDACFIEALEIFNHVAAEIAKVEAKKE